MYRSLTSPKRSTTENQANDDVLRGIRMRVRYEDPFEQWHKDTSMRARVRIQLCTVLYLPTFRRQTLRN
jgi:hypothetical protein